MNVILETAATKSPINMEEVKAMVGLETDQSQFDGFLQQLIKSAVDLFEEETNTALMTQTFKGYLFDWPLEEDYIEIWKPPLASVTSVKYIPAGGSLTEWADSNYEVDINTKPGRVYLGYLKTWPTSTLKPTNDAIVIEYVAGYAKETSVPFSIKNVLMQIVEFWFTNRGADAGKIPASIMSQIFKHKIFYL